VQSAPGADPQAPRHITGLVVRVGCGLQGPDVHDAGAELEEPITGETAAEGDVAASIRRGALCNRKD
jgi:hypothetical protein